MEHERRVNGYISSKGAITNGQTRATGICWASKEPDEDENIEEKKVHGNNEN